MPTHLLDIRIDPVGLATLAASSQRVVLVKSCVNPHFAVVWLALRPAQHRQVAWGGEYSVYAAGAALAAGAVLRPLAGRPARAGHEYLLRDGRFTEGRDAGLGAAVCLRNEQAGVAGAGMTVTAGVMETATLDGSHVHTGALDAQTLPWREVAYSAITDQVLVFPASSLASGMVLPRPWLGAEPAGAPPAPPPVRPGVTAVPASPAMGLVRGEPLSIDFSGSAGISRTVHYEPRRNCFVLGDSVPVRIL